MRTSRTDITSQRRPTRCVSQPCADRFMLECLPAKGQRMGKDNEVSEGCYTCSRPHSYLQDFVSLLQCPTGLSWFDRQGKGGVSLPTSRSQADDQAVHSRSDPGRPSPKHDANRGVLAPQNQSTLACIHPRSLVSVSPKRGNGLIAIY